MHQHRTPNQLHASMYMDAFLLRQIVSQGTKDLSDQEFVAKARRRCKNALRNSRTGAWLYAALERLEKKQCI